MAYTKTTWTDRNVQYPTRFTKSGETTTQVTLSASPGTVTAVGTPVSSTNMNNIENGIYNAHIDIENQNVMLWMGGF